MTGGRIPNLVTKSHRRQNPKSYQKIEEVATYQNYYKKMTGSRNTITLIKIYNEDNTKIL